MLCPNCRSRLDAATLTCAAGHTFSEHDGILALMSDEFERHMRNFLPAFSQMRGAHGKRLLDPTAYPQLPYGLGAAGHFEWRLRGYDLDIVQRLPRRRTRQRILDVGAWNGWLSHRLAAQGHDVTAIDYFVDEYDGLGAKKFYPTTWRAIQMDLTDLSVLDEQFDLVILNRCVQFYADPADYAKHARERVVPGGVLLLTGLQVLGDPRARQAGLARLRLSLQEHGLDFFKPMKGYLDAGDEARLRALGVALHAYPQLWAANLRARVSPTRPRHYYGVGVVSIPSTPT